MMSDTQKSEYTIRNRFNSAEQLRISGAAAAKSDKDKGLNGFFSLKGSFWSAANISLIRILSFQNIDKYIIVALQIHIFASPK